MNLKRFLGLSIVCASVTINASMVSAIIGNSTTSGNYESKERGIIAPLDKDGDGVLDENDKCLDTLPCQKVDKSGCAIKEEIKPIVISDIDKDGVLDNIDKCPDTPKGFEVDATGCSKSVDLNIQFDMDKWDIKEVQTNKIKQFIEFIKSHPEYVVVIEGHTDSDGSDSYNQTLSENRANSVREFIISNGNIPKDKIISKGYGESKPLVENTSSENKAKNRRVIAIIDTK
jgi:OOP family OmpA-OmpF porin